MQEKEKLFQRWGGGGYPVLGALFALFFWGMKTIVQWMVTQTFSLQVAGSDILALFVFIAFGLLVMWILMRDSSRQTQSSDEARRKGRYEYKQKLSGALVETAEEIRVNLLSCLNGRFNVVNRRTQDRIRTALARVDDLERLLADMKDISQIENGFFKLNRSAVDLCEVTVNTLKAFEKRSAKRHIPIELYLPSDKVMVYVDQEKISRIIQHLFVFLLSRTEDAETIRVELSDDLSDVRYIIESSAVNAPQLDFDHFFDGPVPPDVDLSLNHLEEGVERLICRDFVHRHGGSIHVKAREEFGLAFEFTIDKKPFPRILIVDDEEKVVDIIRKALQMDHYQLDIAFYGEEAVEKVMKHRFDLIILDMVLPYMSGYEVIGRLMQDKRSCDIPIIIISGYEIDEERLGQVDENQAIPILKKPFSVSELKSQVLTRLNEN